MHDAWVGAMLGCTSIGAPSARSCPLPTSTHDIQPLMPDGLQGKMYQEAVDKLEARGEQPDGEVLLSLSKEELMEAFGFSLSLAVKVHNRLSGMQELIRLVSACTAPVALSSKPCARGMPGLPLHGC